MNILNKVTFSLGLLLLGGVVFAQQPMMNDQAQSADTTVHTSDGLETVNTIWKPTLIENGVIDRVPHKYKLLPMPKIRENDVAWMVTVWRKIDIRQKQNMAFRYTGDSYTGGGAFIEILNHLVKTGQVQAYSNLDDRFTTPINVKNFDKILGIGTDTQWVTNPVTGEQTQQIIHQEFNVNSVTQYEVKEKWIFDRNRGRMIVRLVGIAPLKNVVDQGTGKFITASPLYWLYYPQLRKSLVNYEVYNPRNDLHRMTWADFLDQHYYESYVVKTSLNNPTGRDIPNPNTLRALAQGQQELNQIINREMDMWEE